MSNGQMDWNIDFENPGIFNRIFIDTNANPNNIWQIAEPGKLFFNIAHSPTHVIITDSINPYPTNDTSSFIITHVRDGGWGGNTLLLLDFWFKMDSDTLNDYGIIELSIDKGQTWYNVLTSDTLLFINWFEPKPSLTGFIPAWTHFSADLSSITYSLGYSDTLLFKFTFISDNIQTTKEGWMIDDFRFEDYWEGIQELRNDHLITISPNPVSDLLQIDRKSNADKESIEVMDLTGRKMMSVKTFKERNIDVKQLTPGLYLLKYTNKDGMAVKRFVVSAREVSNPGLREAMNP
jgi:hypothetical protein